MTWAGGCASSASSGARVDCAAMAAASASSRTTAERALALARASRSSNASCVTSTRACASPSMKARRGGGYCGSSGRYAPPALRMPSSPTMSSSERARHSPTTVSGPTPKPAQSLPKLVRPPIKLPVAQPPPLKHHRSRIRPPARLRRKQARQAPRQNLPPGRVPPRQDALALLSPKQFQPPERTIRMRNRTRQQPHQAPRQPLHRPALKQVRRVFDLPHNPTRRPILPTPLAHAHGQVELRPPNRNRLKPRIQPSHRTARRRVVLKRQQHLEQRMARQRPRRVEHLNQPLKRNLLMAVGQQIARTHPPNQVAHARSPGHVRPQHQRVHKEPHQIVQRAVRAPRNRAPQRDVAAPPQPAQQPNQSSLQHHEQAGSPRTRKPQKPSMQLPVQQKPNAPAAMARHRRPRTVARQLDLLRQALQMFPPERQLARDRAPLLALAAQHLLLPPRGVRIL